MALKNHTYALPRKEILIKIFLVFLTVMTFLFGVDLIITSLNLLNPGTMKAIVQATANPFTALFIGLLVTAIFQSSSATTSMVVALVAAGSIRFESAVPIIMGANIGTTITSTFVSIGFITMGREYKRAIAASASHNFFNILTVCILFPLEYNFHVLSDFATALTHLFFGASGSANVASTHIFGNSISTFLVENITNVWILVVISFLMILFSVLIFRTIIANWLDVQHSKRLFFKNPVYTFFGGLLSTALIRSSTITTSLVVPLVAKKVIKLKEAFQFILGANIGTTVTAFIAAFSNSHLAISIAIVHLLFNCIGVIIFILPGVRELPIFLAKGLSRVSYRYRLAIIVYLLFVFFIIPFSLILISK